MKNGPRHAKRARTTWHVISSNLNLKSSAKNGGSNWVLIQGAIFTVSIVISGLLSLPSCYLGNEVGKKSLKLKMDKICRPGPFRMTRPKLHGRKHLSLYNYLYNNKINARVLIGQSAMVYCAGKPMEKSRRRIRKSLACGSWFTNSSRVLPTSRVFNQPINHRNLWSIA